MLNREEALKICEAVLGHAKSAGAEDAAVTVDSSIESHARFADNRITTSGRAEDIEINATVWVERRRGSAVGNDTSAEALKRLAGASRVRADAGSDGGSGGPRLRARDGGR
jgi:predicted Zn-dependent protease